MNIEGIDLNIDPFTLKEWHELNPEIQASLVTVFKDSRDCKSQIPAGYVRDEQVKGLAKPVPREIHLILQVLDRCRFKSNMTIREARDLLKGEKLNITSHQAVVNMLDRFEQLLGLLPDLPKSVKFSSNKEKYKLQRERREATKQAKELRRARTAKKKLDKEVAQKSKDMVRAAKKTQMSKVEVDELSGDGLSSTIHKLKASSQESRFVEEAIEESNVLFRPTPRQAEFLAAPEKVVFYGGAAGGGKSYALIMDAIRFAHRPAMRSLIIRRRNSELKELISVSKQLYYKAFPKAKFNESKMIWTFPSGATLEFGYFEKEDDKERYIGLPYSYIAWDEIQLQKSPEGFDFLFSRLRTTDPEITCYVRCTGNPGGAPWVKQRFIDPAPHNTPFLRYQPGEEDSGVSYKFIPASMFDNPYLTADGEYEKILKQLPPKKVQQLLYGDWDTVDDGFFNFDKTVHLQEDLPPMHWPIISSMDYGWVDPASCLWAKVNPMDGSLYVYRELEMIRATVESWAQKIREMESEEHYVRVADRVIDHTLFKMTGHTGPSHLETLNRFGITCRPADRQRESGWEQVNQRLLPDLSGTPGLYVHESCPKLIDQLLSAQSRTSNPNDIDETRMFSVGRKHHWDLLDCLRYLCMARPKSVTSDTLLQASKSNAAWNKYNNYFS
jgi:hypothetical protein